MNTSRIKFIKLNHKLMKQLRIFFIVTHYNFLAKILLTKKQRLLLGKVKLLHGDQVRKYTGEPYWTHPLAVALSVRKSKLGLFEAALCHDLYEDTDCDFTILYNAMIYFGYDEGFVYDTCAMVKDLTNVFSTGDYPNYNRAVRRKNEADRISSIPVKTQIIKLADINHNTKSITKHAPKFAKIYKSEKQHMISCMFNSEMVTTRIDNFGIENDSLYKLWFEQYKRAVINTK